MSEALTFIAASLDLPAQTDKCEATLSEGTPGSLGRAGGGQEAATCGRAPLVHVQEVRASATREAATALWPQTATFIGAPPLPHVVQRP